MNVDEIIKLMQAVSDNGLTSLELKEGELKLSLKREKEMPQIVTVSAPSPDAPSMQMAAMQNGLAAPSMMSPAMMSQGVMMPQAAQDTAGRADIGSDKVSYLPAGGNLLQCLLTGRCSFCTGRRYREKGPGTGNYRGHEADE